MALHECHCELPGADAGAVGHRAPLLGVIVSAVAATMEVPKDASFGRMDPPFLLDALPCLG